MPCNILHGQKVNLPVVHTLILFYWISDFTLALTLLYIGLIVYNVYSDMYRVCSSMVISIFCQGRIG